MRTYMAVRPPESFFGELIGPPADIWTFACTVFHVFANTNLFNHSMPSKDVILADMFDLLGVLPPQWWEKWEHRSYCLSSDRLPKTGTVYGPGPSKPLALRIQETRSSGDQSDGALRPFKPDEMANLHNLLAATLKYLPSERITADDILKLKWIQELFHVANEP